MADDERRLDQRRARGALVELIDERAASGVRIIEIDLLAKIAVRSDSASLCASMSMPLFSRITSRSRRRGHGCAKSIVFPPRSICSVPTASWIA